MMRQVPFAAVLLCVALAATLVPSAAQVKSPAGGPGTTLDDVLDLYVRDGWVYYRALKLERGRFDRYVASLAETAIDSSPREERIAFWLNAYNALVLKTVIDHYPIPRQTKDYPDRSIRQIPGAFERIQRRAGRRTLTLDQIEQTILPAFGDPRVFFALGRGAVGSGRLRSETYAAPVLEKQLAEVAAECADRSQCVDVDRANNRMSISSIFSWRSSDFIAAYADKASATYAGRSPIERAALAFLEPRLLTTEKAFLAQNEFKVAFKPFDWTLNDLTGRGGQ
jgi:hypothetical protein